MAVAAVLQTAAAYGQVTVYGTNGTSLRGFRIESDGSNAYTLIIYPGFAHKIPTAAVQRIEHLPEAAGGPPRSTARKPKDNLTAAERAEIDRLLVAYFHPTNTPTGRAEILAALHEIDTIPASEVTAFVTQIRELAMKGPTLAEGTGKFAHPRFQGSTVHVEIHPKNKPPGNNLPLFLALHGGGENSGDWQSGTEMFFGPARAALTNAVFIAPSVRQQHYAEWGRNPEEEDYVREILLAAKRTWDIDTDRIYIGGHSMGGYGTWHIGGHQADVFAGCVAAAGGILTGQSIGEAWGWGVIGNLRLTPIGFVHGTKDEPSPVWSDQAANRILDNLAKQYPGNYVHHYVEIPDGGHVPPGKVVRERVEWVLQFQRNPNPKELTWEPLRSFVKQFHWLYVKQPALFQRIEARITGNTIDLTTLRLNTGFGVLLNDRLVDLTKPVTVQVNGEKAFEGIVQPSITAILESTADKLDKKQVYTARIDF